MRYATRRGLDSAAQPLEVGDDVAIHGDDEIEAAEVVGMDLPPDVVDVIAAQTTLVRGQRVWEVTDMIASRRGRIEADVLVSPDVGLS